MRDPWHFYIIQANTRMIIASRRSPEAIGIRFFARYDEKRQKTVEKMIIRKSMGEYNEGEEVALREYTYSFAELSADEALRTGLPIDMWSA